MFGGKFSLAELMKNASKIQTMMQKAQEELEKISITGESGAGLVKVIVNGQHTILNVQLDDELLKEPKEVIEELVKSAANDANRKILKIVQDKMFSMEKGYTDLSEKEEDDK